MLSGNLESSSIFHTLSCNSHKSPRPVKSLTSAETLASGESIDDGKILLKAIEEMLCTTVDLRVALDSKDLFSAFSTCRMASDRSLSGDTSSIRFDFATRNVSSMIWVPRKVNLADPGTKADSQLTKLSTCSLNLVVCLLILTMLQFNH